MAQHIQKLDQEVINKIAAGEVIERPASVVKELVENSIDAESERIEIRISEGGKEAIQVIDDGEGMSREDVKLALERHATSKISKANDLFAIRSLGFRGEALPSIAAVSRMKIKTKIENELEGTLVKAAGSEIKEVKSVGCSQGTNIIVKNLFYNTPVRYKYLKTTATEISQISDIVNRLALAYPEISFKLLHNQKVLLDSPGNGNLLDTILSIYGKEVAQNMIKVNYEAKYMKISGYISKPNVSRASRKHQSFFINRRYIKSRLLSSAVSEAYHTLLSEDRHPITALTIKLNPVLVDVNVHPTKLEVNFSRGKEVAKVVTAGVKEALNKSDLIPEVELDDQQSSSQPTSTTHQTKQKEEQRELNLTLIDEDDPQEQESENNNKQNKKDNNQNKIEPSKDAKKKISNTERNEDNSTNNQTTTTQDIYDSPVTPKKDNQQAVDIFEKAAEYDTADSSKSLSSFLPLGQVHNTYILAQGEDGFYIIDQHAAHERVLYDRLLTKFKQAEVRTQSLLMPIKLELTTPEIELLEEHRDELENLGFEIESFGGQTYIIRAVPYLLKELDTKQVCLDIIDNLFDTSKVKEPTAFLEELIILISCRSAIKAGKRLQQGEMERLLKQLEECGNQHTCPHGRPTIIHFSKQELDKKFDRI
ncbi:MAG: DNA mismatch repair endonuclease MutL [Bacillota bacterium]